MMKNLIVILAVVAFGSCAQKVSNTVVKNSKPSQSEIGLTFLKNFINGDFDGCWVQFDKEINVGIDRQKFNAAMSQMRKELPTTNDNVVLFFEGIKFVNGVQAPFYSYKYEDDVAKPPGVIFDILYTSKSSKLVAGFLPKGRKPDIDQAASSKGQETVVTTRDTIVIGEEEFVTRGVNIIHFSQMSGLISIQIEYVVPTVDNLTEWAYSKGIPFAKWLYQQPEYQLAVKKAKEIDINLMSEIGVSFINPKGGMGFNTMIEAKDYMQ